MNSWPERLGFFFGDLRFLTAAWTAGRRHSRMSVLLPEPLTPVTSTRRFKGKRTVSQFRAESSFLTGALRDVESDTERRWPREGNFLVARKHWPVMESGWRM